MEISKDLKAGDTFLDGGRTFVVDEVLPDGNYISHVIEPEKEAPKRKKK